MKKRKIWKINYLLGAMIITVLCLVTSCGRNESVKSTGEYISSYESERDGVPVGLFPINTGYFVFSLLDEDLLGKTMRSDDLENFNEIVKDENGYPLYELADSFDNTICWVEYTGEKACYYAYQAENEKTSHDLENVQPVIRNFQSDFHAKASFLCILGKGLLRSVPK